MNSLATIYTKDIEESLKYAYSFMITELLNIKECSFLNPKPTQFNSEYLVPRDAYSISYNEKIPSWEKFKTNPLHLTSPGYVCVACVDTKDQKRIILSSMNGVISFNIYGDYKDEANKALDRINSIVSTL